MPPEARPLAERFWRYVDRWDPDGCWLWSGYRNKAGYGHLGRHGLAPLLAHRFAYELLVGPIPDGLTIDHLCRNTSCVNPRHLEAVTMKVNVLRGTSPSARNARRTHCVRGHPFSARAKSGQRICHACKRENRRRYVARQQAAASREDIQAEWAAKVQR